MKGLFVTDRILTAEESEVAYREWGANCGPNALAFILGIPVDETRQLFPDPFPGFVNPTQMGEAIKKYAVAGKCDLAVQTERIDSVDKMFGLVPAVVRIQWGGPWCGHTVPKKAAYRYTHYVGTFMPGSQTSCFVYDVNGGGAMNAYDWEKIVVPKIIQTMPRADGEWWPTHIWRIHR